ncbi:uncharacterized protein A1O9_02981 [Exophiala aquamarina CBS 119918]|uniref:Mitochondrial cytochrome c oxidase assembly factor n=1 Tax=Exophiala aquamarina CBS 119918 TaxID=1182545 RepID=A0A072Q0K5_9EURO|nr:uncharacterized protein A1O9_02981 [Exophiala aquamarina CBS 119918]KEF61415.1 hypothetical protein A1O9_02981 [Exophiala aquamarina CBS 119918]
MVLNYIRRTLHGSNLEIFKFGLYLSFPIGYMYYFGTNLENRFSVPGFWPTQEQGHKIPYERDEIKAEVERIQRTIQNREIARRRQAENAFDEVRSKLREEKGE